MNKIWRATEHFDHKNYKYEFKMHFAEKNIGSPIYHLQLTNAAI